MAGGGAAHKGGAGVGGIRGSQHVGILPIHNCGSKPKRDKEMPDLAIGVPSIVVKVFENPFDGYSTAIGDRDSRFAREAEHKTIERRPGGIEILVPAVEVHRCADDDEAGP
jgi:hypothetical protein